MYYNLIYYASLKSFTDKVYNQNTEDNQCMLICYYLFF